ncbi:MAG TPA: NRDE family protein [Thermoanaerobaculia bacterium]|nr:NRDE family protein [Thermoanaerobaculia bacterium]
MCTATWLSRDRAFHLFFNRDELRSRERARGPALHESEGVRYLAPSDGRAGGSWIAVSELGLALALLNRSEGRVPERTGSRGRLISRLAASTGPDDFASRLLREPLRDLSPFRLAAFWIDAPAGSLAVWDGERVRLDRLDPRLGILCSSGLGDERATAARTRVWAQTRPAGPLWGPAHHRDFHRSHAPEPSAWSVCMHREDAESVSYTEIEIGPDAGVLRYDGRPPCSSERPVEIRLPRAVLAPAR